MYSNIYKCLVVAHSINIYIYVKSLKKSKKKNACSRIARYLSFCAIFCISFFLVLKNLRAFKYLRLHSKYKCPSFDKINPSKYFILKKNNLYITHYLIAFYATLSFESLKKNADTCIDNIIIKVVKYNNKYIYLE